MKLYHLKLMTTNLRITWAKKIPRNLLKQWRESIKLKASKDKTISQSLCLLCCVWISLLGWLHHLLKWNICAATCKDSTRSTSQMYMYNKWTRYYNYEYICDRSVLLRPFDLIPKLFLHVLLVFGWITLVGLRLVGPFCGPLVVLHLHREFHLQRNLRLLVPLVCVLPFYCELHLQRGKSHQLHQKHLTSCFWWKSPTLVVTPHAMVNSCPFANAAPFRLYRWITAKLLLWVYTYIIVLFYGKSKTCQRHNPLQAHPFKPDVRARYFITSPFPSQWGEDHVFSLFNGSIKL